MRISAYNTEFVIVKIDLEINDLMNWPIRIQIQRHMIAIVQKQPITTVAAVMQ